MTELNITIPILTALIAAWLTYHFGVLNRRKEMRMQFLIDAYRRLEIASSRERTSDLTLDLEKAIADVQLFGSPEHVRLVQEVVRNIQQKKTDAVLNNLLQALRRDLRRDLRLKRLEGELAQTLFVRFDK